MKNLPITLKIASGFVAIIAMFIIVVSTTSTNIISLNENTEWLQKSHEMIALTELVLADTKDAELAQRGYLITGSDTYLKPYSNAIENVSIHLDSLMVLTSNSPELQKRVVKIDDLVGQMLIVLEESINLRKDSGFEASKKAMMSGISSRTMSQIRIFQLDLIKYEKKLLTQRQEASDKSVKRSQMINLWLLIIAAFIITVSMILVNQTIVNPLKRLSIKSRQMAQGNLTNEFNKDNRTDEIGLLALSFKIMQENFLKKAQQAEEIAKGNLTINVTPLSESDAFGYAFSSMTEMLNSQMLEIQQGVNVLSTASTEMMAVMSQLSSGSAETASSVSQTTATIEEIKQTTEVANQKANEVTNSSRELASVSKSGNESVQSSIAGMNNIKVQMESIAAIVIQLSEKSHKIGEIANTVNDIAEQSNLLAVNAAIEAAKAGEEGKGFAVVAQEIKNLASRSKASTVEIRSILTDIQKEIGGAVMATEQGGKVIDENLNQSSHTSKTISLLAANAEEALQANMMISASSQQQLVGMEQIANAMESIKEASAQNVNSTKQAEISVSELTELGDRLINLLSRYSLRES